MSQNPNEHGYFTNLLSSNQRPYGGSSNPNELQPSPPQHFNPQEVWRNQQFAFQGFQGQGQFHQGPQFFNPNIPNTFPTPPPQASQQSQPSQFEVQPAQQPFKVPKARSPAKGRGKKGKAQKGKRVVDLDEDDEESLEELALNRARKIWTKNEEITLCEVWVAVSQDHEVGNDRDNDFYWNEIYEEFNKKTSDDHRTKNMLTAKWGRMHPDCQKFNACVKHLTRRSGENEHDHIDNAMASYEERFGKKFAYKHAWEVLKKYPKWDAAEPLDLSNLVDMFGPDKRPRPERPSKRAGKKQKSTDTSSAASSGGSQTSTFSGQLSEKYLEAKEAQLAMLAVKKQREQKALEAQEKLVEMQEMQLLMLDADTIRDPAKANLIRRRQALIMKKYEPAPPADDDYDDVNDDSE